MTLRELATGVQTPEGFYEFASQSYSQLKDRFGDRLSPSPSDFLRRFAHHLRQAPEHDPSDHAAAWRTIAISMAQAIEDLLSQDDRPFKPSGD